MTKKNKQDAPVPYVLGMELKGDTGQFVSFDGTAVRISERGWVRGLLLRRSLGEKTIPLAQLTSVTLRPPMGVFAGFIQFGTAGSGEIHVGLNDYGLKRQNRQNAVTVLRKTLPVFLGLRDTVEKAMAEGLRSYTTASK